MYIKINTAVVRRSMYDQQLYKIWQNHQLDKGECLELPLSIISKHDLSQKLRVDQLTLQRHCKPLWGCVATSNQDKALTEDFSPSVLRECAGGWYGGQVSIDMQNPDETMRAADYFDSDTLKALIVKDTQNQLKSDAPDLSIVRCVISADEHHISNLHLIEYLAHSFIDDSV